MKYEVKQPILGFEQIAEVELVKHDGITTLLKGCGEDCISISLINASVDHKLELPRAVKVLLDIDENSNYSVYFVVIIHNDIAKSVINLGAPLIFNEDNMTMAQAIFNRDQEIVGDLFE